MSFALTDDEWLPLSRLPESTLVELAIELDILVPEKIDARSLLEQLVPLIVERARTEGIPLSKYDREDLAELSRAELSSLARLQGLDASADVSAVLARGERVYRTYQSTRPGSAVAMCLPMLLTAVARAAS